MAANPRLIGDGAHLQEGGKGLEFEVKYRGKPERAFAIRHRGRVYAYLNRCAHRPMNLDWRPGEFFDISGLYLICATHGALYAPDTGRCIGSPCQGGKLFYVPVQEQDGKIFLLPNPDFLMADSQ